MYFWLSVFALSALLVMLTFRYRAALLNPVRSFFPRLGHYQPVATFAEQVDAGLTSSTFDIEANIRDGDSRAGLDERGTQEVLDIMRRERVNFDQARLIRQNQWLAANGIDPSGMPLDAKAVTRL
ncbi:hypothetical protein BD309DRAFT_962132 [Dichomitus squalens]|uniref:Uncharacterized protein n=1 Tax=Dichomitus squalens TaxID=114155 RepID=A0A4Q9NN68_9APHY|nr:uncharacterized protein DICSQDRAFT_133791 [Dichomitus squalens LYAD-421 SS1]EJF64107.1 hypothetical protein DICSQDRAFT_133791 [Dichomitus squalens LYAD-421 SS1]TBU27292.1 hypothetical protein BD311DRAFT_760821 [Dichomitus squalens]TBU42824.1 hypothetical protein BD309DRAFT_962132 [Dichomitus squalens]TBU53216.1 hypothetical protein BD310DRAFT_169323 [Dichomitus squalens]